MRPSQITIAVTVFTLLQPNRIGRNARVGFLTNGVFENAPSTWLVIDHNQETLKAIQKRYAFSAVAHFCELIRKT